MKLEDFYKIQNCDTIFTASKEGEREWEVRYICRSEGWVEVSDEEDTIREIFYPAQIIRHVPFV